MVLNGTQLKLMVGNNFWTIPSLNFILIFLILFEFLTILYIYFYHEMILLIFYKLKIFYFSLF